MDNREALIKSCGILLQAANTLRIPVLWCEQAPLALGSTVAELRKHLETNHPIEKTSFNCCGAEGFPEELEKTAASTVILCGIEAHVCVFQTAADLIERGLNVHVIADGVSSRTAENKQIGLARAAGAGAVISSTEMLLFEWLKDARHEKFKDLARLIK